MKRISVRQLPLSLPFSSRIRYVKTSQERRFSFKQLFLNDLLSSARPFERPFTRPSFKRPPSSNPSRALLLRAVPFGAALLRTPSFERPSFNCSRLQHALLRKICKNIQESTPSYPRTVFPQVNDKGTPDSLHALNGVFLQNNKPFSLHATLCLLFFFRTPL